MENLPRNNNDDPLDQLEQDSDFQNAYGDFADQANEKEHPLLASYDQPEGAVLRIQTESEDGTPKELTFVRTRYEEKYPQLGWSMREQIPGSNDYMDVPVNLSGQDNRLDNHEGPRQGMEVIYAETEDKIFKSGSELEEGDLDGQLEPIDTLDPEMVKTQLSLGNAIQLKDGSVAWRISRPIQMHVSGKITGASVELPGSTESESKPHDATPENLEESKEEKAERARITPEVEDILSNYQFLKSDIRQGAVNVQNVFTRSLAAARNAASTPGKIRRNAVRGFAEMRHDRASNKTDKARLKYEEAAALQDQSNSRIVNWYRDRKAARRYTKYMERVKIQGQRSANLDNKTHDYNSHVKMMKDRKTGAQGSMAERHRSVDQHRKVLMEQRIAAESRKLERQKRRTQRLELLKNRPELGHEAREKLASELSAETRKEIREKAIAAIKEKNIRSRTMINY